MTRTVRHIVTCMHVFEFGANFIKTKNGNTKFISRTSHYQFDRSNNTVEVKSDLGTKFWIINNRKNGLKY